jgi:hypothetical protein
MASLAVARTKIPKTALWMGTVAAAAILAAVIYLERPAAKPVNDNGASPEAKAYVSHLELSDVKMAASENFMQQQVVEIQGTIANRGPRTLTAVDVYCLFAGPDGREVHRERQPILGMGVGTSGAKGPLPPNAARSFRLPFDSLPDGWNEAMPKLVIARIQFADNR